MNTHSLRRICCATLIAFSFSVVAPSVHAGMVASEAALAGSVADASRDRLQTTLARADIQAQLQANGVDANQVAARVAALTDAEVVALNERIDQVPAGGSVIGVLLTIFLVLLITDLIGWTDVFSFTRKGAIAN